MKAKAYLSGDGGIMNDIQIDSAERELWAEVRERVGKDRPMFSDMSTEEKRKYELYSCYRMVNSILAYDWHDETPEELLDWELHRSYKSYLQKYVNSLGKDTVLDVIKEQMDSIDKVEVDVGTDSEGVHYNSIKWKKPRRHAQNGYLKDFSAEELIKKVQANKRSLYSERELGDYLYEINVRPPLFGAEIDERHPVWVDIIKEGPDGNQERVYSEDFLTYEDAKEAIDKWVKEQLRVAESLKTRRMLHPKRSMNEAPDMFGNKTDYEIAKEKDAEVKAFFGNIRQQFDSDLAAYLKNYSMLDRMVETPRTLGERRTFLVKYLLTELAKDRASDAISPKGFSKRWAADKDLIGKPIDPKMVEKFADYVLDYYKDFDTFKRNLKTEEE